MKIVAVDDGYAQAKVYSIKDSKPVKTCVRSAFKQGKLIGNIGGGYIGAYVVDGERYTIADDIESEDTRFPDFHISRLNRALVNHALLSAGFSGKKVHLVTGVPIDSYFRNGEIDKKLIDLKRENLLGKVEMLSSDIKMPDIGKVDVFAQAASAWVDYVMDDDLNERHDPCKNIAIIDIGGRTTDIAVIGKDQIIDYDRSGTAEIGSLKVYKNLESRIRREWDIDDPISLARLDRAVRENVIEMFGQDKDIESLVLEAIKNVETEVHREIERKIGKGSDLSAVVFVGGASLIFKGLLDKFCHNGVQSEEPEYANARGLFKYAKYQE